MRRLTKNPILVWVILFSLFPLTPAQAQPCRSIWERLAGAVKFWRWSEVSSPVGAARDAAQSMELEKRIRAWGNAAGRTSSHREVKRSRIASFVLKSLEFDRYWVVVEYLKPVFLEIQLSYALYNLNKKMRKELVALTAQLKTNATDAELAKMKSFLEVYDIKSRGLADAVARKQIAKIVTEAQKLVEQFDAHSRGIAMKVAYLFDEYEASHAMLETCRKSKDGQTQEDRNQALDERRAVAALEAVHISPEGQREQEEEAPAGQVRPPAENVDPPQRRPKYRQDHISRQAARVLDRLETGRLLEGYRIAKILGEEGLKTPETKDFKEMLKDNPEAADARRRWNGNREFFAWLLSISPSDATINLLDKGAAKLPWLNHPKFRAFLQFALSETHVEMFYPDIARVVDSTATGKGKLEMIEIMNAGTDDRFLVTLRRRLDARDEWEDMRQSAGERTDKDFLERMQKAEVAAKLLGDLNPWQTESNRMTKLFRRLIDAVIGGGAIGGAYYLTSGFWGDKTNDAIEEVTGKPKDKNGAELTEEERRELEALEQDATLFLRWLQDHPEGKELFKKYLEDKKARDAKASEPRQPKRRAPEPEPAVEEPPEEPKRPENEKEKRREPDPEEPDGSGPSDEPTDD